MLVYDVLIGRCVGLLFEVSVGADFEGWNYIQKGAATNYILFGIVHGIVGTS
jgi:hypothetical protein